MQPSPQFTVRASVSPARAPPHPSVLSSHCHTQAITHLLSFSMCMCVRAPSCSRVLLCRDPWTVAHQAPLSTGFPRQEYWSGLPFPSPEGVPEPGTEPVPPALQVNSSPLTNQGRPFSLDGFAFSAWLLSLRTPAL